MSDDNIVSIFLPMYVGVDAHTLKKHNKSTATLFYFFFKL